MYELTPDELKQDLDNARQRLGLDSPAIQHVEALADDVDESACTCGQCEDCRWRESNLLRLSRNDFQ